MKMMAKKREPVVHKPGNIDANWEQATWVDRVREKKQRMGIRSTTERAAGRFTRTVQRYSAGAR
jgi:hypothetical protein